LTARIHYLIAFSIVAIVSVANIPLLQTVWRHSFDDGNYSHAYLIPFVSIYLFHIAVSENRIRLRATPSFLWLGVLLALGLMLYATAQAQVSLGYWFAWMFLLCAGAFVFYRPSIAIAFPFLLVIFILPAWGIISSILQAMAVFVVSNVMRTTDIPVFVDATFIHIPAGVFEIANGCSGLRYLIVSWAMTSIFSYVFLLNRLNTFKLFLIATVGALLTNWLRIVALILIGHYSDMQSSLVEDHNFFGWYLFIPFCILFYYVGEQYIKSQANTDQRAVPLEKVNLKGAKTLVAGTLLLLISTLTGTSLSHNVHTGKDSTKPSTTSIHPQISFADDISTTSNSSSQSEDIYLSYTFNGKWLDGKVSYYENNFIPEGWIAVERLGENNGYIDMIVRQQTTGRTAKISYRYWFNETYYTSSSSLKRDRIKLSLIAKPETRLDWLWYNCKSKCT
jgi:exosortase